MKNLVDEYLKKPVSRKALLKILAKYLPYKQIIKEKAVSLSDEAQDIISLLDNEQSLLLKSNFGQVWHEIKDGMAISRIAVFAKELSEFAASNQMAAVQKLANELYQEADNFNILKTKKLLTRFKTIMEQ
jgi:YesN/AraC family two-component response regulator